MTPITLKAPPPGLVSEIMTQSGGSATPELVVLSEQLRSRFGSGVAAALFYGSCLRHQRLGEGLIDLYVLVDGYDVVYRSRLFRWVNAWLPPNVFMVQARMPDGRLLHAKCAVVSLTQFERGTALWRHSYLWGRFAQPSRLIHARDDGTRQRVHTALARAVITLLQHTLPCMPDTFDAAAIWRHGLTLSYGTELRPESGARSGELVEHNPSAYRRLLTASEPALPCMEALGSDRYANHSTSIQRRRARRQWRWRRATGRALHVVRLMKSVLTFENGVDYLAWKLERHTGRPVDVTPRLRKHPLIFGWPLLWRLWREKRLR